MDDRVEIQLQYDYYCKSRITPIFMSKEDLLRLTYDNFLSRVLAEILHIVKTNAAASFRLSIVEPDRPDIDISVKYSSSKRIEDILLAEKPDRYTTTCGRKNWIILNKDVALLK